MDFDKEKLDKLLSSKKGLSLFHRESQTLEFKEQFNFADLAEYFRDFAAFANVQGGYLIFGVENCPRIASGLSEKSIEQFEKIDEATITNHLNETFLPAIEWQRVLHEKGGRKFGIFYVSRSSSKPVIAKKNIGIDDNKDKRISDGDIYYRYGGRTQKIGYSELQNIINEKAYEVNRQWQNLTSRIAKAGPGNVAILDTEKGLISKGQKTHLIIDEKLAKEIKFIREGEFDEKSGATTLRLIGEVTKVDQIEVTKILEKQLIDQYPLSYSKLEAEIKKIRHGTKTSTIQNIIKENNIKNNKQYSAYNFRNRDQKDAYEQTGKIPKSINSIYNQAAVDFIFKVIDSHLNV